MFCSCCSRAGGPQILPIIAIGAGSCPFCSSGISKHKRTPKFGDFTKPILLDDDDVSFSICPRKCFKKRLPLGPLGPLESFRGLKRFHKKRRGPRPHHFGGLGSIKVFLRKKNKKGPRPSRFGDYLSPKIMRFFRKKNRKLVRPTFGGDLDRQFRRLKGRRHLSFGGKFNPAMLPLLKKRNRRYRKRMPCIIVLKKFKI